MTRSSEILGEAVFGTMNGLFADGSGVLQTVGASAEIFEFGRRPDGSNLIPERNEIIFFRRPVSAQHGELYDLIGLCIGALDTSRRDGYIGYCAAVAYGHWWAYSECFENVRRGLDNAVRFFLNSEYQFRSMHGRRYFDNGSKLRPDETVRFSVASAPGFVKQLYIEGTDAAERALVLEGLIEVAKYYGKDAPTISVSSRSRPGAELLSRELVNEYNRQRIEQQRADEWRRAKLRDDSSEIEDGAIGDTEKDPFFEFHRRIRELEERVDWLENNCTAGAHRLAFYRKSDGRRSRRPSRRHDSYEEDYVDHGFSLQVAAREFRSFLSGGWIKVTIWTGAVVSTALLAAFLFYFAMYVASDWSVLFSPEVGRPAPVVD